VIPFIHIGGYRFASYGIMMATGMFVAYYVLRADLRRRQLALPPLTLIIAICGSGFVASKLYLALEFPSRYLLHPSNLLHQSGFAFYGGVFGGIGAILLLARRYRIATLSLFDAVSPAGALGYGFGRVGCFLAGDGDYGTPTSLPWGMAFPHGLIPTLQRVHPTPIYEVIGAALITAYLWRLGRPDSRRAPDPGVVFAQYLLWTGLARFLVEFIRLNVRVLWNLSNAQCVALCSIAGGLLLISLITIRQRRRRLATDSQDAWAFAIRSWEIET
jgi:phosphatidylglycerol---prolipoprotein diacylglyceryl transferase